MTTLLIAVIIGVVLGIVGFVLVVGSLISQSPFEDDDDVAEPEARER